MLGFRSRYVLREFGKFKRPAADTKNRPPPKPKSTLSSATAPFNT